MHHQQQWWLRLVAPVLLLTALFAPSGASGRSSGEPRPRAATGRWSEGAASGVRVPGAIRSERESVGRGAAAVAAPLALVGDINGDGIVDIRDYGIWRQAFGATNCGNPADLSGDCIVDIRDYGIWRQHFGETGPTVTPTAPATSTTTPIPTATPTPTVTPTATPTLPGRAYVTNSGMGSVSVIDTTSNTIVGAPIGVGNTPEGIGVDPTVHRAYVTNSGT